MSEMNMKIKILLLTKIGSFEKQLEIALTMANTVGTVWCVS